MHWIPYVMVRIAVVFTAGILWGINNQDFLTEQNAIILLIIFTLLYFAVCYFLKSRKALDVSTGILGLGVIFLAGYLNVLLKTESGRLHHLLHNRDSIRAYQVMLTGYPEEKEKSWKRTAEVQFIRTVEGWKQASGKVNLYWPKQEPVAGLDFGDKILIHGQPQVVTPPRNPNAFDYKRYLGLKNIYHHHFLKQGDWKRVGKSTVRGFIFYAHRARNWSASVIHKFIAAPQEVAIVLALLLGVTDGIDTELLDAYAASGTMHVLAVSGLHVSIIYGILLLFFQPIGKRGSGLWISTVLSIILLWAYAFITGLSPSVLRAVAMFSFMALAKPMGRSTHIYNTLAASAFCLLVYDPYLILSVGFQLSYAAVLGIVYLQRPLSNLLEVRSRVLDWAWQITCMSIAAQVATISLSLLYFHQFPVYFLVANLFVIPGSSLVLTGGLLLLVISPFEWLASWLGLALEGGVKILNVGVLLIERWPMSLINHIVISPFQSALLMIFILTGLFFLQFKKIRFLLLMTTAAITFSGFSWYHHMSMMKRSICTVYHIPGTSAMEWMKEGYVYRIRDSLTLDRWDKIRFHVEPHRLAYGAHTILPVSCRMRNGLEIYHWEGRTFVRIVSGAFRLPQTMKVDCLVISNNSIPNIETVAKHINFNHLILDSSNSYRYCKRLEKEAQMMNKASFSVLEKGAWTMNLTL